MRRRRKIRVLKPQTVVDFFVRRGWKEDKREDFPYRMVYRAGSIHPHLFYVTIGKCSATGHYGGSSIEARGWRHRNYPNLHLDSYWGLPRTKRELEEIYNKLVAMYREVDGIDLTRIY